MKEQLKKLINDNPGSKIIQSIVCKIPGMKEWIEDQCQGINGLNNFSQKIHYALYNYDPNCTISNKARIWNSLNKGYRFCGKTGTCQCAKDSVSNSVKTTKAKRTKKQINDENIKRSETNLKEYGVANIGQSKQAKDAHVEFYNDKSKVKEAVEKQQSTLFSNYGVSNAAYIPGVDKKKEETNLEKYGFAFPMQNKEISDKAIYTKKEKVKENGEYHNARKYYDNLKEKYNILNIDFLTPKEEYYGVVDQIYYDFKCIICNHEFKTYISCGSIPICKICNPTPKNYKSGEENEVADFISSLGIPIERSVKWLIGRELDIVCHEQKIAIEYCGLYWHSELGKEKNPRTQGKFRHLNKLKLCNEKGYRLITIFSDEWLFKKDIVKSKLISILKKNTIRIGARSCKLQTIDTKVACSFYEKYHLQGKGTGSNHHIGLLYNNELVACMSFGKKRTFINNKNQSHEYELIRYATSITVSGGASRLLAYFESKYSPKSIISYADARWSEGSMYYNIGFKQIDGNLNPGYWYTNDYVNRLHRYNFTKGSLVKKGHNKDLTEWEIMQSLNFDRIWDCGQYKFEKIY